MLLTTQALAALHFVLVLHTIDARTSNVVCSDAYKRESRHGPSLSPDNGGPERDEPSPKECQVHALLQQAQILKLPAATVQTTTTIEAIVSPTRDMAVHRRIRVYLVSPAHSPSPSALA